MNGNIVVQLPQNQVGTFFDTPTRERLDKLGEIVWNPLDRAWTAEELREALGEAEAVITSWGSAPISDTELQAAPRLRLIAHMAGSVKPVVTTMSVYDRGVTVLTSNYAIAVSVSEAVLALMLAHGHKVIRVDRAMRNGVLWKSPGAEMETSELRERTVGLVGLGLVSREVIKLLRPFEPKLLGYDPYLSVEQARQLNVELVSLPELLRRSEIISLHAPQVPQTYHMIGANELSLIADGALLVNTARGDLIDQEALVAELRKGRFAAALDVFEREPLPVDSELRSLDNVIVRPHLAGVNPDSKRRIGRLMVEELEQFFAGEPLRFEVKREQLANMT